MTGTTAWIPPTRASAATMSGRLVVVHVRHMPVLAEMSPMTVELAKQNLEAIEADMRRASEDVLR